MTANEPAGLPKLKPCPFCGGEGMYASTPGPGYLESSHRIVCRSCDANVDGATVDSAEASAAAWNTRAQAALAQQGERTMTANEPAGLPELPYINLPQRPLPSLPSIDGVHAYAGFQMLDYGRACATAQREADQSALSQQGRWMPIESAPRDMQVLASWFDGSVGDALLHMYTSAGYSWTRGNVPVVAPTHWQPLPAASRRIPPHPAQEKVMSDVRDSDFVEGGEFAPKFPDPHTVVASLRAQLTDAQSDNARLREELTATNTSWQNAETRCKALEDRLTIADAEVAILQNNLEAQEACTASVSQAFDERNEACARLYERAETAEAELAACKRDGERYRFFKKCFDSPMQRHAIARALGVEDAHLEPSIDAAIDAAIQAGKEGQDG